MAAPAVMSCSRTYPVAVEDAFDRVLAVPLEQIFNRRYGPIPPVTGTELADGTTGPWGQAGQVRTVRMSDGGTMHEMLTSVDRPHTFGYTLAEVTGPMKPLAATIDGVWAFDPAGTGVRITWTWTVHPASAVSARLLPVFARVWRGFARRSFDRIEELLVPA